MTSNHRGEIGVATSTRRGLSTNSRRNLSENRARRIQQGIWLRDALTILLDAAEAKGSKPRAKELLWALGDAGEPGMRYLDACGYPNLRNVQLHLKAIRTARIQKFAFSVSEVRGGTHTMNPDDSLR